MRMRSTLRQRFDESRLPTGVCHAEHMQFESYHVRCWPANVIVWSRTLPAGLSCCLVPEVLFAPVMATRVGCTHVKIVSETRRHITNVALSQLAVAQGLRWLENHNVPTSRKWGLWQDLRDITWHKHVRNFEPGRAAMQHSVMGNLISPHHCWRMVIQTERLFQLFPSPKVIHAFSSVLPAPLAATS